jgi:hypothetical protein
LMQGVLARLIGQKVENRVQMLKFKKDCS